MVAHVFHKVQHHSHANVQQDSTVTAVKIVSPQLHPTIHALNHLAKMVVHAFLKVPHSTVNVYLNLMVIAAKIE